MPVTALSAWKQDVNIIIISFLNEMILRNSFRKMYWTNAMLRMEGRRAVWPPFLSLCGEERWGILGNPVSWKWLMCHRPLSEILKGSGIGVQGDSFLMTADIVIDRIPGKKLKNVSMSDSPSSLHIAPFAILTAYDYQQQVQLLLGLLWRFLRL